MITEAKIVGQSVDPREYHANKGVRGDPAFIMSRGELCDFYKCPAKWISGATSESNGAMEWGELIDCLFLTPGDFSKRFAVCPSTYPCEPTKRDPRTDKPWNRNATYCTEWEESQRFNGKTPVKSETHAAANVAVGLMADEFAREGGLVQVHITGTYVDKATGFKIPLKALLDFVPPEDDPELGKSLVDLKTTGDASPRTWARHVDSYWLDAQGGLYLDLWTAATNEDRCDFRHLVQESSEPYHVECHYLSQEFIDLGRLKYTSALKAYCQCLKNDVWPGYPQRDPIGRWGKIDVEKWMLEV